MKRNKPLLAISGCLLGKNIRYNGGHCREDWVFSELSKYVDFFSVCPELEMGLGVPREEIHLFNYDRSDKEIKLKTKFTNKELTHTAINSYQEIVSTLQAQKINGHILTRKSPTCGTDNVKVYVNDLPNLHRVGTGLYARHINEEIPELPLIDSGRIKNVQLRENFVKQVFAHHRFTQLDGSSRELHEFHRRYKYTLMEHSQDNLRRLGAIAANHANLPLPIVYQDYFALLMNTLSILPTVKNRINALVHIFGYFKNELNAVEKKEFLNLIEDYRHGISNYSTINTILGIFGNNFNNEYIQEQLIFGPYPKELKLLKTVS